MKIKRLDILAAESSGRQIFLCETSVWRSKIHQKDVLHHFKVRQIQKWQKYHDQSGECNSSEFIPARGLFGTQITSTIILDLTAILTYILFKSKGYNFLAVAKVPQRTEKDHLNMVPKDYVEILHMYSFCMQYCCYTKSELSCLNYPKAIKMVRKGKRPGSLIKRGKHAGFMAVYKKISNKPELYVSFFSDQLTPVGLKACHRFGNRKIQGGVPSCIPAQVQSFLFLRWTNRDFHFCLCRYETNDLLTGWKMCCRQGTSDECEAFYQIRPATGKKCYRKKGSKRNYSMGLSSTIAMYQFRPRDPDKVRLDQNLQNSKGQKVVGTKRWNCRKNCFFLFAGICVGDPHYQSFDGLEFTFNGHGEYTLMKTTEPPNAQVQVYKYT